MVRRRPEAAMGAGRAQAGSKAMSAQVQVQVVSSLQSSRVGRSMYEQQTVVDCRE